MRCAYCGTAFYYASLSGPAEDCDCGKNTTRAARRRPWWEEFDEPRVREPDNDQLERLYLIRVEVEAEREARERGRRR